MTTPAAPSGLSATPASSPPQKVSLSWSWTDDGNGGDGFRLFRDGSQIADVGIGTTNYDDTGVSNSSSYNYEVRAYNGDGESMAGQATASATTDGPPTSSPTVTMIFAQDAPDGRVHITLLGGPANLYRDGVFVAVIGGGYEDTAIAQWTTYSYTLTFSNQWGEGPSTPAGPVTTKGSASAPTNLVATSDAANSVPLNWTPGDHAAGIELEISTDGGNTWAPVTPDGSFTADSGTVSGLLEATTYHFRLRSLSADSWPPSDWSNVASATTFGAPPPESADRRRLLCP